MYVYNNLTAVVYVIALKLNIKIEYLIPKRLIIIIHQMCKVRTKNGID
jgi:hypothetical protein